MNPIVVFGPDGQRFEFPAGTDMQIISASIRTHYGNGEGAVASRTSSITDTSRNLARSPWQRFGDVFSDTVNTSWIVEDFRAGFAMGSTRFVDEKDREAWFPQSRDRRRDMFVSPVWTAGDVAGVATDFFNRQILGSDYAARTSANWLTAERERRDEFAQASKEDPFWKAENPWASGAAAFSGVLAGAALDPTSYLAWGRTLVQRAATQMGLAGGFDALAQMGSLDTGLSTEYDFTRTALSATAGAAFSVTFDVAGMGLRGLLEGKTAKALPTDELRMADDLYAPAMTLVEAASPVADLPRVDEVTRRQVFSRNTEQAPGGAPTDAPEDLSRRSFLTGGTRAADEAPLVDAVEEAARATRRQLITPPENALAVDPEAPQRLLDEKPAAEGREPDTQGEAKQPLTETVTNADGKKVRRKRQVLPDGVGDTVSKAEAEQIAIRYGERLLQERTKATAEKLDARQIVTEFTKLIPGEEGRRAFERVEAIRGLMKPEYFDDLIGRINLSKDGELDPRDIYGKMLDDVTGTLNTNYVDFKSLDSDPERWVRFHKVLTEIYSEAIDQNRVSFKDTRMLARKFGTSLGEAAKLGVETKDLHARLHAANRLAVTMGDRAVQAIEQAARQIREGGGGIAVRDLATLVEDTVVVTSLVTESNAGVARALNALKIRRDTYRTANQKAQLEALRETLKSPDMSEEEMQRAIVAIADKMIKNRAKAGTLPDRELVMQELRSIGKIGVGDYLAYYMTGNLLSSLKTFIRNLTGTPFHMFMDAGERYVAAGIGELRTRLPGQPGGGRVVTFGEANAYTSAAMESIVEAFQIAMRSFKEAEVLGPARMNKDGNAAFIDMVSFHPFKMSEKRLERWRGKPFSPSTMIEALGWAIYSPIRTLGFRPSIAADAFFRHIAFSGQVRALAYREANYRANLLQEKDLEPGQNLADEKQRVFEQIYNAMIEEPSPEALETAKLELDENGGQLFDGSTMETSLQALGAMEMRMLAADHAAIMTFTKEFERGSLLWKAEQFLNHNMLLKAFSIPFFRSPIRLLQAFLVDRTPLAVLNKDFRAELKTLTNTAEEIDQMIARGGAEADMALARLVSGGALMALAGGLWAAGNLVGERSVTQQEADGIPPYSLKLPGTDTWVSYQTWSPIAEPLGLVADAMDAIRAVDFDEDEAEKATGVLIAGVMTAIVNNTLNKTFMRSMTDFIDALNPGTAQMTPEAAARELGMDVSRMLAPRLLWLSSMQNSIATEIDPAYREAESLLEHFKARMPLLSKSLPQKVDWLGRPRYRDEGKRGILQAFNTGSTADIDPMDAEISRLASNPRVRFAPPNRVEMFNGSRLTAAEGSRMQALQMQEFRDEGSGMNAEDAVRYAISTPEYQSAPDEVRITMLEDILKWYRDEANTAARDPSSPYYQRDIVMRTGTEAVRAFVKSKAPPPEDVWERMGTSGMDRTDPEVERLFLDLFPERAQ